MIHNVIRGVIEMHTSWRGTTNCEKEVRINPSTSWPTKTVSHYHAPSISFSPGFFLYLCLLHHIVNMCSGSTSGKWQTSSWLTRWWWWRWGSIESHLQVKSKKIIIHISPACGDVWNSASWQSEWFQAVPPQTEDYPALGSFKKGEIGMCRCGVLSVVSKAGSIHTFKDERTYWVGFLPSWSIPSKFTRWNSARGQDWPIGHRFPHPWFKTFLSTKSTTNQQEREPPSAVMIDV